MMGFPPGIRTNFTGPTFCSKSKDIAVITLYYAYAWGVVGNTEKSHQFDTSILFFYLFNVKSIILESIKSKNIKQQWEPILAKIFKLQIKLHPTNPMLSKKRKNFNPCTFQGAFNTQRHLWSGFGWWLFAVCPVQLFFCENFCFARRKLTLICIMSAGFVERYAISI